jgi:hypothetical protein
MLSKAAQEGGKHRSREKQGGNFKSLFHFRTHSISCSERFFLQSQQWGDLADIFPTDTKTD